MAQDEDSTRTRAARSDPSLRASGERRQRFFPGARIGAYVLERPLGEGGMGTVWVARHAETGGELALKLLPIEEGVNSGALERFRREGQAQAAAGAHPNVLRVHACGEQDGWAFLAMELARGGDLRTRLKAGPLEPRVAAEVVRDLARGLAHVHAHGVLHRDLKPGNVVFDEHATPKLMDFGLARLVDAQKLTATGTLLGTPAYMAPEQAGGEALDERADVYALGAVLFHCLTGRPPFEADSVMVLVRKALLEQAPRPSALNGEVPPALDDLLRRTLAKAPDERPSSAGALADELDRFVNGELEVTRRTPPALVAAAALSGLTALGLVGAAAARGRGRADDGAVAALRSDGDGAAAAAPVERPRVTELLAPPLDREAVHESLAAWTLVPTAQERLEVVAAAHASGVELLVEALDADDTSAPEPPRAVTLRVPLELGESRHEVALQVGWNRITLRREGDGRPDEARRVRHVLRLPAALEHVAGTEVVAPADGSSLRLVPPGTRRRDPRYANAGQRPDVVVTAPFFLGTYEVSWRQYRQHGRPGTPAFQGMRPELTGDDQPLCYASMEEVYAYLDAVALRLPTDDEWEHAAVGQLDLNAGKDTVFGGVPCAVDDERLSGARARWGHWHLYGNVYEWLQYVLNYDSGIPIRSGGNIGGDALLSRVDDAVLIYGPRGENVDGHLDDTGFRVARGVGPGVGAFFRQGQ